MRTQEKNCSLTAHRSTILFKTSNTAVFKTVERLLWSLVGSIPSLSATTHFPSIYKDYRVFLDPAHRKFIPMLSLVFSPNRLKKLFTFCSR